MKEYVLYFSPEWREDDETEFRTTSKSHLLKKIEMLKGKDLMIRVVVEQQIYNWFSEDFQEGILNDF